MASGKDPNTLAEIMQRAINKVLKWGDENGLTFNPDKTSSVIFTKRRHTKSATWRKLTMGGIPLEYEREMKYLGVILSQNLTWTSHVKERIGKAKKF